MSFAAEGRVTAVLGPTNTGKTYLAIERMLGYRSGIIGFPLRLLARENYDRALKIKGPRQVALVTGEEKIVPPGARYFFCTAESMPLDRPVEFLAVDEIQLCADPERGHVFTDRLLHMRGSEETMLLGAETIRPVLQSLVPEAEYVARPRFSTLRYAGHKKITRLPPRSAVIAFSASQVYALAELMRRQRGGTAVVLGALSPRTRNAQVAMFEAGEVDYLVATDAIGMGLNLSLDHVAFARLSKFDGRGPRRLTPAEAAQIAGRAGRHMNDGTFGTTDRLGGMDEALVEAIEDHRFDPLRFIHWRSRALDFASPDRLLRSLEQRPPRRELLRVRDGEDHQALATLARDREIDALTGGPEAVRLLWDVCQVPDFQKILTDQHARLLGRLYRFLRQGAQRLPEDWVAKQLARLDRTDGDIDSLVARIAHIRTWTYIAYRSDWLADPLHWQERARLTEDKLSDSLHDRLTQRFVDRRAAMLVRRLKAGEELLAAVRSNGEVLVEGEYVGRLDGFRFQPDRPVNGDSDKPLLAAARRVLASEIPARVARVEGADDGAFALHEDGTVAWREATVARLAPGAAGLAPGIEILSSDFLDGAQRERLRRRLADWLAAHLRSKLPLLFRATETDLSGPARGLLFQLVEAFGTLPRGALADQIAGLGKADRRALAQLGVRLGAASVFFPALLRPQPARLRALLWAVQRGAKMPASPDPSALSFVPAAGSRDEAFCLALGYRLFTRRRRTLAVRADALERLSREAYKLGRQGSFGATKALARLIGCQEDDLAPVLAGLGYRLRTEPGGPVFVPRAAARKDARKENAGNGAAKAAKKAAGKRRKAPPKRRKAAASPDSPFAKLRDLKMAP